MSTTARFLHVTDTHLSDGARSDMMDAKLAVPGIEDPTKIEALKVTAEHLAERLKAQNCLLDGVLFTGDAQDKAAPHGHDELRKVLQEALGDVMHAHARFVATPGNHDVPKGSSPGAEVRYAEFTKAWRKTEPEAVTPWLDKIDAPNTDTAEARRRHSFVDPNGNWAIYPINSSNWSHTQVDIPREIENGFGALREEVEKAGDDTWARIAPIIEEQIRTPLKKQFLFDIAHVSEQQLEALKPIIRSGATAGKAPVRIVVLHHHLIAPTLRAEIRPFADIMSLSGLRTYLRQNEIDIVIHGHKHVDAISYDSVYDHDPIQKSDPRRMLVLSGGTFDGLHGDSSMSLIEITGLPSAPNVEVERIRLGRRGLDLKQGPRRSMRLWRTNEQIPGGPVVIHGDNIDDVYARAVEAASKEANQAMLIVHLDLPDPKANGVGDKERLPFPSTYRVQGVGAQEEERQREWVKDLAEWWQLSRSNLEARIPYIHGTRLRRFGNQFDQIKRIVSLLKSAGSTSRAVAVLVDPLRDFEAAGSGEEFASFCLVQFRRRPGQHESVYLDCTAYYRAQEFKHWWPINVAELRLLQTEVAKKVSCVPGRITTIAADARVTATRSPGQVAIPVIDRWLDRSPEKIFALACCLCSGAPPAGDVRVLDEWRRYLESQIQATEMALLNEDASPVAVNSLEVLAAYMEAHPVPRVGLDEFTKSLKKLARENRIYEASSKDLQAFNNWAEDARSLCKSLLSSSPELPIQTSNVASSDD